MKPSLLNIINDTTGLLILRLVFNLTITSRNAYEVNGDGVDRPEILRGINEIQHQLLGRILAINSSGYLIPEAEFVKKLFAISSLYGCDEEFEYAIQYTLEAVR